MTPDPKTASATPAYEWVEAADLGTLAAIQRARLDKIFSGAMMRRHSQKNASAYTANMLDLDEDEIKDAYSTRAYDDEPYWDMPYRGWARRG